MTTELNWAGNYRYRAATLAAPAGVDELQQLVAGADRVRALGSRHSFNSIADTSGTLVSLHRLDPDIVVDEGALTVTVGGGTKYGILAEELSRRGFALHNLASLPHISVAGAIATATHGSGNGNGNLATAVRALEIVTGSGELVAVSRDTTPDFAGMVVGLGALGIVTRVTLEIQPIFDVRQDVFENLPWSLVLQNFDAVTSAAYSVSLFTDWSGDTVAQAWLKSREPFARRTEFFGGTPATEPRHPLPGISGLDCTEQLGVVGPWHDRLAHFRLAFTPSNGAELQSEYLLPREHAVAAIEATRGLSSVITPLLLVSEVRTVAADDLWLSANYGRDGIALHFTWKPEQEAVEKVLLLMEAALAPFLIRPHWGKLFQLGAAELAPLYPKFSEFRILAEQMDPQHTFRNDFLERTVFGG
ncbi:FAD-binding protein [Cryobacterium sp. MLB-32]|uniref:FAD-binding protein n=1 Tax=Cryobacterium sp. MLB-32 TaxID=1529318 RepID=UPI0004E782E8|nr:FAD-binding protein [Cryobacterium sp. MLB-32]KFF59925.1 FAD-binding protein [Cryobacterium sp. MLB-32]